MPAPKDPVKYALWKKHVGDAIRGIKRSEETRKKISDKLKGRTFTKNTIIKMRSSGKLKIQTPAQKETQFKHNQIPWNKDKPQSEESRKKMSISHKNKPPVSEETKRKISNTMKNKPPKSEETKRKMSISAQNRPPLSEEKRKRINESLKGRKNPHSGCKRSIETKLKIGIYQKGRKKLERTRIKMVESSIGGFWYGNVRYDRRKKYCELWNADLWERIDAFQNYRSILSGKTKDDNKGKALSRHHVYWQEKACCEWDEDEQGYYAMINIGTAKKPNMYRYYVGEDPNKFVLLTKKEHGMVAKDKLTWIKRIEKLIDQKYGGKCFYTKEEYANLNQVKP